MPINVVPQFLHGKFRYAVAPAGIPGTPGILGIPGIPEITNQFRKVNLRGSTSGSISSFASAPVPTGIPGIPGMLSMKKKRGENQRLTGEVAPRIPVVTPPPPPLNLSFRLGSSRDSKDASDAQDGGGDRAACGPAPQCWGVLLRGRRLYPKLPFRYD